MSHKAISWSGVFPAVTTQFRNDFSLDLDATHTVIKNGARRRLRHGGGVRHRR